jgi:thiamine-phosphate pyrophosphorylase
MKGFDLSLYAILDPRFLRGRNLVEVARVLVRGGATCLQLRDKEASSRDLYEEARLLKATLRPLSIPFIVNDRLDIVLAVEADGVHLGEEDIPISEARRMLGRDKILGASAASVDVAVQAEKDGTDYIGFGAVFPTGTKEDAQVSGLALLSRVKQAVSIPVVAIGGIKRTNAVDILRAGADGLAIISDLLEAEDVETRAREFRLLIAKYRTERLEGPIS